MPILNTVKGTNQSETIDAADGVSNGIDFIFGLDGNDTIFGLGGNDIIDGGAGADTIDGGTGNDTATYASSNAAVAVNLATGLGNGGFAQGDTLVNVENVVGSAFNDALIGNAGANKLIGGDGNDNLTGGAGADELIGGEGHDTTRYQDSGAGVTVDLTTGIGSGGTAQGDTYDSIDNAIGSNFDDILVGTEETNLLNGVAGNDILKGAGGSDTLFGGFGEDALLGGDDSDLLFGDAGNDTLTGGEGHDRLDGGADVDSLTGGIGNDTYVVDNAADVVNEAIGEGLDKVQASASYTLKDGVEVEILETTNQAGITIIDLFGNEFDNTIIGNATSNVLGGSSSVDSGGFDGLDTFTGGFGGDTFVWTKTAETGVAGNEADIITDFSRAQDDVIALNPIDADETVAGDHAFTFIGTGAFTAAGQINFFTTATDTFIQMNTDGDNFAEATIHLVGVHNVDASFFVL
jgi:Ca2+-binding RTX toxin-like protein